MNKTLKKAYDALKRRFAKKDEVRPVPRATFPSAPGITFWKLESGGPWVAISDKTGSTLGTAEELYPELATALNKPPLRWKDGGAAP